MERLRPRRGDLEATRWNVAGEDERWICHRAGCFRDPAGRHRPHSERDEFGTVVAQAKSGSVHRLLARLLLEQTARLNFGGWKVHERRRDRLFGPGIDEERLVNTRCPL